MKIHGIEFSELVLWEIKALDAARDLLHKKADEVFTEAKRDLKPMERLGWRKLVRAGNYIAHLQELATGKTARSLDRDKVYPVKRDEEGNRLCRWCQKSVGKRRSYCSDECRMEVDCRTNAGQLRYYVKQRDQGVCAGCKCDTNLLARIVDYAGRSFTNSESYGKRLAPGRGVLGYWTKDVWKVFIKMGFNYGGHLWEADHIVEVVNGGESSLANMQTLCMPCHKAKTKELARQRARARRGKVQPFLFAA